MTKAAAAVAMTEPRIVPARSEDEMGVRLDEAEAVQRKALEDARACAMDAVLALRPFETHEGRVLPGIERAVKEARAKLTEAASNLAAIVALHLDGRERKAPAPELVEQVDEDLVVRLREAGGA